jgi:hypothetical protein
MRKKSFMMSLPPEDIEKANKKYATTFPTERGRIQAVLSMLVAKDLADDSLRGYVVEAKKEAKQ